MPAYTYAYRAPDNRKYRFSGADLAGGLQIRIEGPRGEHLGDGWLGPEWGRLAPNRWTGEPRHWHRVLREKCRDLLRIRGVTFDDVGPTTADRVRALFAASEKLTPSEVAHALGLPVSRASAYCGVLASRGQLQRIGPGLYTAAERGA